MTTATQKLGILDVVRVFNDPHLPVRTTEQVQALSGGRDECIPFDLAVDPSVCRNRAALAFGNLAFRQQVAMLKENTKRPKL